MMCNIYRLIIPLFYVLHIYIAFSFNFNTTNSFLHNNPITHDNDSIKLPSSIKFDLKNIHTLPTNEDNIFSHLNDTTEKEIKSEKKLQEINEAIKDGGLLDPLSNGKLFQNEGEDEQQEVEVLEPSLGKSGNNYKEGVESTTDEFNDISNKLQSDGDNSKDLDDFQLKENLLNKLMKSHHP